MFLPEAGKEITIYLKPPDKCRATGPGSLALVGAFPVLCGKHIAGSYSCDLAQGMFKEAPQKQGALNG